MTGQWIDVSDDPGLETALALINRMVVSLPQGHGAAAAEARAVLAAADPPSAAALTDADVSPLTRLARRLHDIAAALDTADVDDAADRVNDLLAEHPAQPHLAKEDGVWRLHHHPVGKDVVAMWTAITADAFGRLIGSGRADRVGVCAAGDCGRAFVDRSRNGSRRFCSTTCQNRVKAASYRHRHR